MEQEQGQKPTRLFGLDFARFLAFAGMVFVNFHVVTGGGGGSPGAEIFLYGLEGKAAATFVVLAGIGLGIGARRDQTPGFNLLILKRAAFLFVAGMINLLVFPADILHYYAIYFVFALFLVRARAGTVLLVAAVLPLVFVGLLAVLDYEAGWDWETLEYAGFWTPAGFARNLLFNGWHPLVPWFSFLALGIFLSRLQLAQDHVHRLLVLAGAGALGLAYGLSFLLSGIDPELDELVSVSPIPPMPLYMLGGGGAAVLVIGLCLMLFRDGIVRVLAPFLPAGRQALTLYIAHILLGMGVLEALGLLGGQSAETAILAAGLFIIAAVIYATVWARFFRTGPVEWLMRRLTG